MPGKPASETTTFDPPASTSSGRRSASASRTAARIASSSGAATKWAAGEKLRLGPVSVPTGAWMVVVMVPALVYFFFLIRNHYRAVAEQLTLDDYEAPTRRVNASMSASDASLDPSSRQHRRQPAWV